MNSKCPGASENKTPLGGELTTELLILPDGQVLVHNLTQPFAELLKELNPECEQISSRANAVAQASRLFDTKSSM